ncbi:hypothetical protein [Phormidesmis sp. 146-33]
MRSRSIVDRSMVLRSRLIVDRLMVYAIALLFLRMTIAGWFVRSLYYFSRCRSLDGLCGSCGVALCANRFSNFVLSAKLLNLQHQ